MVTSGWMLRLLPPALVKPLLYTSSLALGQWHWQQRAPSRMA
jgi:hypothetical protein